MKATDMVCGFFFNPSQTAVLLIMKARPEWMAGRLNGIGGKVELGETALEAMTREFKEEAGITVLPERWTPFATYDHLIRNNRIYFYRATGLADECDRLRHGDQDGEWLSWQLVDRLMTTPQLMPNLKWLVPLALQPGVRALLTDYA